jgi:hypothetical protein
MNKPILDSAVKSGISYNQYRSLIDQLLMGEKTTGENDAPEMVDFTRLNVQRMEKADKKVVLDPDVVKRIEEVHEKWYWLVITEAWNGDAAHNLPIIAKMAEANSNIELKILLRDENPTFMELYQNQENTTIPKLICLRQNDYFELGAWGPRPKPLQEIVRQFQEGKIGTYEEMMLEIQRWYAKDKGKTVQQEISMILEGWALTTV